MNTTSGELEEVEEEEEEDLKGMSRLGVITGG